MTHPPAAHDRPSSGAGPLTQAFSSRVSCALGASLTVVFGCGSGDAGTRVDSDASTSQGGAGAGGLDSGAGGTMNAGGGLDSGAGGTMNAGGGEDSGAGPDASVDGGVVPGSGGTSSGGRAGSGGAGGAGAVGAGAAGTDAGVTTQCQPGAKRCNSLTPQTCDASGAWTDSTACRYVCRTGVCSGVCMPGTTQCKGASSIPQTCDANGTWQDENPCPNACSGGACAGTCSPGAKQCNGLRPQTCDGSGSWVDGTPCQYVCSAAGATCTGVCAPGTKRCSANGVQACSPIGQWGAAAECAWPAPTCNAGACVATPSCRGLAATCGPSGQANCCSSPVVTGGTYARSNEPTYPATVSDFRLDQYEVTVGRFRKFVAAYSQSMIAAGSGRNPNNASDSGWNTAWNASLPADAAALSTAVKCESTYQRWTDSAGANENRPMNCVNWYEALAFCVWDAGRLATEAEWNYAAAGGSEQRHYPWSNPPSSTAIDASYASYADFGSCWGDGLPDCAPTDLVVVGSKPNGNGRWGQSDLSGNLWEWNLDWLFGSYPVPCVNCGASIGDGPLGVIRGGAFTMDASVMVTSYRYGGFSLAYHSYDVGLRCARSAP